MPSAHEWRVFGQWALVGIGSIWSLWTLLRMGWIIALVTAAGAFALAQKEDPGRTAWGYVTGMGLAPLWVVWGNRATPGPIDAWLLWGGLGTAALGLLAFLLPRRASRATPGTADPPLETPDAAPDVTGQA